MNSKQSSNKSDDPADNTSNPLNPNLPILQDIREDYPSLPPRVSARVISQNPPVPINMNSKQSSSKSDDQPYSTSNLLNPNLPILRHIREDYPSLPPRVSARVISQNPPVPINMNSKQSSNKSDDRPDSTSNLLNPNLPILQPIREDFPSLPPRVSARVISQNPPVPINMNSKQSSNKSDDRPYSTSNPLNPNIPILQHIREDFPSLPPRVGARVISQNPPVPINMNSKQSSNKSDDRPDSTSNLLNPNLPILQPIREDFPSLPPRVSARVISQNPPVPINMNSKQSSNKSDDRPYSTSNPLNPNLPILQNIREDFPSLPPRVGARVISQNPPVPININSKQSSNKSDDRPYSTSNPLNPNLPILQNIREDYPSLPPRVISQNPPVPILQPPNYPVQMTRPNEQSSHQTQRSQKTVYKPHPSLPNLQPPKDMEKSSRHNKLSTSNFSLPSEQKDNCKSKNLTTDQANYPRSNVSSNESQLPELQEFNVEASFEALNNLNMMDVDNMQIRTFTEYLRHALLCGENIAYRNEQKFCFRNIEDICRRTRLEVEKQNATARNLYNQGYPYAIKDFIFALARITTCWRILSGYYTAIKSNLLIGQVNTEISEGFLKSFEEWEKESKRLIHNLFITFSNLDYLYTDEDISQSQNDASGPRYRYQSHEQTDQQQYSTNHEQFSTSQKKSSTESENTNIGKDWDQSAWGITHSTEYASSSNGENKNQPPVHQPQSPESCTHSSEENQGPSTSFVFRPEQFPPLREHVRKPHRQPSMENVDPSTGAIRKTRNFNGKSKQNSVRQEQVASYQQQTSTNSVGTNSEDVRMTENVGPSTGAIRKIRNSNTKPEQKPVHREQAASYQRQTSTGSVGTNSENIRMMENVGPSTGAIRKIRNYDTKPEQNPVHQEEVASYQKQTSAGSRSANSDNVRMMENAGPSTGTIRKIRNSNTKPDQIPVHQEQAASYQKQTSAGSISANSENVRMMENAGPSIGAIRKIRNSDIKPEKNPVHQKEVESYHKQTSAGSISANSDDVRMMENEGSSTGAIKKVRNFNTNPEQSPVHREQVESSEKQTSTGSVDANSQDFRKMEYVSPSTGTIRKVRSFNGNSEQNPMYREQVASYQNQTSTGSVGATFENTRTEYAGPSTGAIRKIRNFNTMREQNPVHYEHVTSYQNQFSTRSAGANSRAIKRTGSVDFNQESVLLHHQEFPTHLMQSSLENSGSNNNVMNMTGNYGFEESHTSAVNQEFSEQQMQFPSASTHPSSEVIRMTSNNNFLNECTSENYYQEDRQSLTHQMQPSQNTNLSSDFTEMTNRYEQQPLNITYFQSLEDHGSQYNSDQATASNGYEHGSYETSRRGSYELSRRGWYEPGRRGSYEPFRRSASRRGPYEPSRRGAYEPSRRGAYEPSRRGAYEPSRRGTYDPSRRGRYHDHFAYDRGISLIPKGYNYLVQFSYKAVNVDKYQDKLLKNTESIAESTAMTVLNDKDDDIKFEAKLKAKHAEAKILSVKLKQIWIRLDENQFMAQCIKKISYAITIHRTGITEPVNFRTIGNRILENSYTTADQFVEDIRDVLTYNNTIYANDLGYQINLAMFEILFEGLLKEFFPDLKFNYNYKEYDFSESVVFK